MHGVAAVPECHFAESGAEPHHRQAEQRQADGVDRQQAERVPKVIVAVIEVIRKNTISDARLARRGIGTDI